MVSLKLVLLLVATLAAAATAVEVAPLHCTASLTPTLTWTGSCVHPTDGTCFSPPRMPATSDVLLIKPQTTMILNSSVFGVTSLIVGTGASLVMYQNAEIFTKECFVVEGTLNMTGEFPAASDGPGYFYFPEDPSVPLATCADMPGGFSPRICGPGAMFVYGAVHIIGNYAASWAHTIVAPSGRFAVEFQGSFVGLLENYGSVAFRGLSYLFGSAVNHGVMRMSSVQVGSNYPIRGNGSLNVTNYGLLDFDAYNGVSYPATLTNYNTTTVTYMGDPTWGGYAQYFYFSPVFNHGNMSFLPANMYQEEFDFLIAGDVYNSGTMSCNASTVWVNTYLSLGGGKLATFNGGRFGFGNGAGVDRHEVRECEMVMPPEVKARRAKASMIPCTSNDTCQGMECCTGGFCQPCPCSATWNPCGNDCCIDGQCEPLEPYHTGWYCSYDVWRWQQNHECRQTLKLEPLTAEFSARSGLHGRSVAATRRYSFQSGSIIDGDIVSTESVEIIGDVTMGRGTWHALTEFGLPIFVGGGSLHIAGRSKLVLGLDSSLSEYGSIKFSGDASLLVPRHAALRVTNHSLTIPDGTQVHVDGTLLWERGAQLVRDGRGCLPAESVHGEGVLSFDTSQNGRHLLC